MKRNQQPPSRNRTNFEPSDCQKEFEEALSAHKLGRLAEAEVGYRALLAKAPCRADALHLLGILAHQLGRTKEAAALIGNAIRLDRMVAAYYTNFGNALMEQGFLAGSLVAQNSALRLSPDFAEAHFNRGNVLVGLGRNDEALLAFGTSLRIRPDYADALVNSGATLMDLGRPCAALSAIQAAISFCPDRVEFYSNRGNILKELGRYDDAVAAYETAILLNPSYPDAHSNRIMALHYRESDPGSSILAAARRFAGVFAGPCTPAIFFNTADPHRRLRIGYVSGDLFAHPVGFFLLPVLGNHDRRRVEIFCYSTSRRSDGLTRKLRASVDHWRDLTKHTDAGGADVIRADGIDILIDLSGHTSHNRLSMFSLRPAPIQATWLGFWGTTGLSAMDYIISDAVTIPKEEESFYSEQVIWLPNGRFCYAPPQGAPPPANPPCVSTGITTFGSFNNLTKIGPEVVRLWSEVLHAVPQSRLLLKWKTLADEYVRNSLLAAFASHGIASARLILRGISPHLDMLAQYEDVDIALDPFPFSGGITSCEALWMGVPVVTMPGANAPSRQTKGFLYAIGHTEWVASANDDYVRIAAKLAGDGESLSKLRQSLRSSMASSPLCDGKGFADGLETAYRTMWQCWCARNTGPCSTWDEHQHSQRLHELIIPNPSAAIERLYAHSVVLHQASRLAEAECILRRILVIAPAQGDSLQRLGLIAYQSGHADRAIHWLMRAIVAAPQAPEFQNGLGLILQAQGALKQATDLFLKAVRTAPESPEGYLRLARLCRERGQWAEARCGFVHAIVVHPELEISYSEIARLLQMRGDLSEAATALSRALAVDPANPIGLANFGTVWQGLFQLEWARRCYLMCLCFRPELFEIYNNLGAVLQELGCLAESTRYLRRALDLQPENHYIGMNLVFAQLYIPGVALSDILAAATGWIRRNVLPSRGSIVPLLRTDAPERPRRLGFISADFREHAVGKLIIPVIEGLSNAGYKIICYSNSAVEDHFTARFQRISSEWRPVCGMGDAEIAELIRQDGVDVLFDLGGFSAENRLATLACRPAPVQVSWVGYPGTTGLDTIDYIIADRFQIPHGAEQYYSEQVLRFPNSYVVFEPPADVPPPGPLPAHNTGQVTFGSFNGLKKLNKEVLDVWSRILLKVPSSRMVIKAPALAFTEPRRRLVRLFGANDVPEQRLVFLGASSPRDHLLAMQGVDLALDTFPYAGGMTTLECLWMGLPVVTYVGEAFCSRHSLSYLSSIGLGQLATTNVNGYIDQAVSLATDLPRLAELRSGMRRRMQSSPLCDIEKFVNHLERMLDIIWQRWRTGCQPTTIDIDRNGNPIFFDQAK